MVGSRSRILSVLVVAFLCGRALSAQCVLNSGGLLGKGTYNEETGIRTIRVAVPATSGTSPTINTGTREAMEQAIDAWNQKTSDTKIFFQKVEYSQVSDMKFALDNAAIAAQGGTCAQASPGGDVKFESAMDNLGANPNSELNGRTIKSLQTQVFTHELGHVMNLGHASGSIMNPATGGSNCQDTLTNHMPVVSTIQPDDATNAKICANKGDPVPDLDNGFGQSEPNESCWDVYWVVIWFDMNENGQWEVIGFDVDFVYTTCDEDPYPS